MFNYESVAEPRGIGLNMLGRSIPLPAASVGRTGTRFLHYAPIHGAWSWVLFSCDFVCRPFPPAASALVGGHRGTLFCPRLAEMPRGHPALDARSESHIVRGLSMALPYGYPKIPSASLLPQPIDDVTSFEAYGGPNAEAGDASRPQPT